MRLFFTIAIAAAALSACTSPSPFIIATSPRPVIIAAASQVHIIGTSGYVTEREPISFCPAPIVFSKGCRELSTGKITITSTGHEAWLSNPGNWLKSPAELPGIREVFYGVKLNDKENGFLHEGSWKYLRSEQAHKAILAE